MLFYCYYRIKNIAIPIKTSDFYYIILTFFHLLNYIYKNYLGKTYLEMIVSNLLNSLLFWSIASSILLGYSSLVKADHDDDPNPVLLVSLDGMRASSLDQHLRENPSSNFFRIINKGVKANYMTPIFPSLTFPNHWTLVTGII